MPGGYSFDRFHDDLALRIKALPEFRSKLADSQLNLDHPVWVEDNDFDLSRHLQRIALPSPGGRRELAEVCGHLVSAQLDRSKPMWEMWVIEGIAETDAHGEATDFARGAGSAPGTGGASPSHHVGCSNAVVTGAAPRLSCGQTISGTRKCATANSKSH